LNRAGAKRHLSTAGEKRFPSRGRAKRHPTSAGAEMPEQGQRGDTGGDTPLRGLQSMKKPTPEQQSKKQGTAKAK